MREPTADPNAFPRVGHFAALWLGFVAFAVYGSLAPFDFEPLAPAVALARFREVLAAPLTIASRSDWAANVLLFLPIGFFGMAACTSDRTSSSARVVAAFALACLGIALSLAVELSQIWFPLRFASKNDVAAESIGCAAGIVAWLTVGRISTTWLRSRLRQEPTLRLADRVLLAYVVGLVFYSLLPLDLSISPAKLWHKYREGQIQTIPFAAFDGTAEKWLDLAAGVLRFVPLGIFVVTAFAPAERPVRSLPRSLILALSVASGIELAQVFVVSRQSDATELVCALAGVTWGAAWRRRQLRRHSTLVQDEL